MEDLVTVFRSADDGAREDAAAIAETLEDAGISAVLLDDRAPGVPKGAWEVRTAAADSARAEDLIGANHLPEDEFAQPDPSNAMDWVSVFRGGDGAEGEGEALTIKGLLEANGIDAVVAGLEVPIPSLGVDVRVAAERQAEARRIISEARSVGRSAADEAEAETEK